MPNIGPLELIIVLVDVLLLFGAKHLPELGRSLGSGMKEFKEGVTGKDAKSEDPAPAELDSGEPEATAQPIPQEPVETPVEAEPRT